MRVYPNPEKTVEGVPVKVRDPRLGDYIPAEGRDVEPSPYWLRRLRDGDVLECAPPAPPAAADSEPEPEQPASSKRARKAARKAKQEATAETHPPAAADSDDDKAANLPHDAAKVPMGDARGDEGSEG